MKPFIKIMKALSDPSRVKIIKILEHRTLCVCEIQNALGLAQSTISKHLKILEEAELITYFKQGPWVNYQWADSPTNPYSAVLLENLRHWLNADPEVAAIRDRLPKINRENICRKSKF